MSIPFSLSDSHGHETTGLVYLEGEFLVFAFQTKKWGLFDSSPEKVMAELGVIQQIRFGRGLFSDNIFIIPKNFELTNALPGDHKGEVRIKVPRRYRQEAQEFVDEVRLKAREHRSQ